MLQSLPTILWDRTADWSAEFLDFLSIAVLCCVIAVSILGDLFVVLPIPKILRNFYEWLMSPFRCFLALQDLGETPGPTLDVSSSKMLVLMAFSCLLSLSSFVSLILRLLLGDRSSALRASFLCFTWCYISFRVCLKTCKTPPYCFVIFASVYALQLSIGIGFTLLSGKVRWSDLEWSILNLLFVGAFIYIAGTLPLTTSLPCQNVAGPHDVPSHLLSNPEDNVTLWSWGTFKFVEPLMILATRRTLGETDVWSLSPYFRHRNLFNKRLEYQSQYPTHSLLRFLIVSNALDLFLDLVLEFWSAVVGFVPPYALKEILAALAHDTPAMRQKAYIWAVTAFLANLSFAQVDLFQAWHTRRCYERTRGQLFCAIHYKALRRREVSGNPSSNEANSKLGRVVNIIRGDSYAVSQRFWEFSGVCTAPVRLVIALIFLYKFVALFPVSSGCINYAPIN